MATQLFLTLRYQSAENWFCVNDGPTFWDMAPPGPYGGKWGYDLHTSRSGYGSTSAFGGATAAGPKTICCGGYTTRPFAAAFTLAGTITFNLCALETNGLANAGLVCRIYRYRPSTNSLTLVVNDSAKGTELGTSESAQNWSVTPTSTDIAVGDQLWLLIGMKDAGGTMAAGYSVQGFVDGASGGSGDSWIQLTENVSFFTDDLLSTPAGTTLYLRDTSIDGNNSHKLLDPSRGAASKTVTVSLVNGPTSQIQWTDAGGGSAVEWYSARLQAFTLSHRVMVALTDGSTSTGWCSARVELAVVDADGSNAQVWSAADMDYYLWGVDGANNQLHKCVLAGQDLAVATGKRLRLRVYADDHFTEGYNMTAGAAELTYDGPTPGPWQAGDSYIVLSQSPDVYSPAALKRVYKRIVGPQQLGNSPGSTLYIAPDTGAAWVRHIHIINPTGATRAVTLSIGADGAPTRIFDARLIAPGEVIDQRREAEHWLNAGEVIQANADAAAACVIVIDAIEYTL